MAAQNALLQSTEIKIPVFGSVPPVLQSRNTYEALDNFTDVPVELLCSIIDKLGVDDLNSLSLVSSDWRTVARDSSLWKRHCKEYVEKEAPCKCCASGIHSTMQSKAALYGWNDVFQSAKKFRHGVRWGQVVGAAEATRAQGLQYKADNKTLINLRGRWVSVQLGAPISNPGVYHYSFNVDAFSCNGMMIGLVSTSWQGVYPGTGNAGVSATPKSCAYYSHSTNIFRASDLICMVVDLEKNVITFHRNGEIVGTVEAPPRESGEELRVVGAFCGTFHQLTSSFSYAHPPNADNVHCVN